MRAAVWLLLAGCVCTAAEEARLPRELLELLSGSEIRSISDLQRRLETQSVENEVMEETKHRYHKDVSHSASDLKRAHTHTHTRHRRSTVLEEALPAGCKIRSVVYQIPRSAVDSSAANFLLWPSCVELQRCTGCCNTGNMRCRAARTHTRTVKVAKVEFVRRRPKLREVQVSGEEEEEEEEEGEEIQYVRRLSLMENSSGRLKQDSLDLCFDEL
ncbi:hypothetical protein CesoFtcFv8_008247 [Champsocephalus esox]|uniref:Platelet-derived growth factor subunit A n=1 Tax=Champsocephalus esox TaxID=159716 RepID=A0AAN8C706_9TELE|nr:hypothetical protein CesoFtcFv8_008247 [Champsocephalus esox]